LSSGRVVSRAAGLVIRLIASTDCRADGILVSVAQAGRLLFYALFCARARHVNALAKLRFQLSIN
jgi:hypothetical protein